MIYLHVVTLVFLNIQTKHEFSSDDPLKIYDVPQTLHNIIKILSGENSYKSSLKIQPCSGHTFNQLDFDNGKKIG